MHFSGVEECKNYMSYIYWGGDGTSATRARHDQ